MRPVKVSRTARQHGERTQSAHRASNLRRSRPRPRSLVSRQHPGCAEHGSSESQGFGRPPGLGAALQARAAASPCHPKPMGSFSTWLTACGRWILSVVNVWCRYGGQRTLPVHSPALPKSRSGRRGVRSRLLEDLAQSIELEAVPPMARYSRCGQRSLNRSAHVHGLTRLGGLADGRVERHRRREPSTFRNYT